MKEQRRQKLIQLLPEHGFSIPKAAIAAGYSELYAKKRLPEIIKADREFCDQIVAKQRACEATTGDKREDASRVLSSIMNDPDARNADRINAAHVLGRMSGWMSETRILETPQRQRELDASYREQCDRMDRIALLMHREHITLPGDPPLDGLTLPDGMGRKSQGVDGTEQEMDQPVKIALHTAGTEQTANFQP